MYKQVDKTKENNSRAVANSVGQKKSGAKQGFGFVDNRSETKAQINFQKMVNNNQLLEQEAQVGVMDDNYATQQLKFIQNKSNFSLANNNYTKQMQILQRVRNLDSGAKVLEQDDMLKKRKFFLEHIKILEGKEFYEKANVLREQLKKYPELRSEEVIFQSVGGKQPPSTAYALWAHSSTSPYYIFPTSYAQPTEEIDATLVHGRYQFAITVEHPSEVLVGTGGHDSLAKQGNVWYAGTVYFNQGQLLRWNNDTGHYKTTPEYRAQALRAPTDDLCEGLLPLTKFQVYEV